MTRTRAAGWVHLDRVPPPAEAPALARRLRTAWGVGPAAHLDLDRVCERLDVEVSELSLGAAEGGAQGFLTPRRGGGFRIEVDPEPRCGWHQVQPQARAALKRHRRRFLLCHELAHTVFYEDGPDGPRRVVPSSNRQETFCDELARALLIPAEAAAALPLDPESVLQLQHRYDVSMEIALRSVIGARENTVGWLLLHRCEETRIQWTSAERGLTAKALESLQTLARRAAETGRAATRMADSNRPADALFLEQRDQVIVTWNCSITT